MVLELNKLNQILSVPKLTVYGSDVIVPIDVIAENHDVFAELAFARNKFSNLF